MDSAGSSVQHTDGMHPVVSADLDRYHSAKLSGIQQFADDPTADYMIGHRAIAVLMPDGARV
eukprot:35316-Amphidinium_carterae.1